MWIKRNRLGAVCGIAKWLIFQLYGSIGVYEISRKKCLHRRRLGCRRRGGEFLLSTTFNSTLFYNHWCLLHFLNETFKTTTASPAETSQIHFKRLPSLWIYNVLQMSELYFGTNVEKTRNRAYCNTCRIFSLYNTLYGDVARDIHLRLHAAKWKKSFFFFQSTVSRLSSSVSLFILRCCA